LPKRRHLLSGTLQGWGRSGQVVITSVLGSA
jgi:hypothetical protein